MKVNLVEYIHPKMDILFVALNAPEISNLNGHWLSRNLSFWNLLFDAKLITRPIFDKLTADEIVFGSQEINSNNWVFGVTDLNREIVQTNSFGVQTDYDQIKRILNILDTNEVKKMCLMHSKVIDAFENHKIIKRNVDYGLVGNYSTTKIYKAPFHNASIPNKYTYYKKLLN